ncbi:MAG TPA: lysyl-tRNA synthetase [Dermatophilaceae bacterium]|nr:lysyl-tRNA synthetase [Dermatophilaceae bacterium]
MWDAISPYLSALIPTIGMLIIGFVVIRGIMRADRDERQAQRDWAQRSASEGRRRDGDTPES